MKLFVKEKSEIKETEVYILCHKRDESVNSLVRLLKQNTIAINGHSINSKEMVVTSLNEILYFESVDKQIFFYTSQGIFETGYKLYEIENICEANHFLRISKTTIVNLRKINSIQPEEGRRLKIKLLSDEWLLVSRMYTNALKSILHT